MLHLSVNIFSFHMISPMQLQISMQISSFSAVRAFYHLGSRGLLKKITSKKKKAKERCKTMVAAVELFYHGIIPQAIKAIIIVRCQPRIKIYDLGSEIGS